MIEIRKEPKPALRHESVETLLLMAVLGQGAMQEAARRELHRRKALVDVDDWDHSYITNLSGIC